MTLEDRARRYVSKFEGAIQGARGSDQTFIAAQVLVRGFDLDDDAALRILQDEHNPHCHPQWSESELRHKVRSAREHGRMEIGCLKDAKGDREQSPDALDVATFDAIIRRLFDWGHLDTQPDVWSYCIGRRLVVGAPNAGCFALPPATEQGALLKRLASEFDPDTIARSGLVKRSADGRPDLSRLTYPSWRLCIPWRNRDGRVQTLQRRFIGNADIDRKYVFPAKRSPEHPFGAERLDSAASETAVAFCEGAIDTMALRLLFLADRQSVVVLGLPGTSGWRSHWASYGKGRTVYVATDPDEAGEAVAATMSEQLYRAGASEVIRLTPPDDAKDWASHMEQM